MDNEKFKQAYDMAVAAQKANNGIGTLGEKVLHATLKHYIEPDAACHEIKTGRFVADIVNHGGIVEIQTGGFVALRKKLEHFLEEHTVTIVHPIAHVKHLTWIDPQTGEANGRRKSPKKGKVWDVLPHLYWIRSVLEYPNLKLRLMLIDMEEYRLLSGWGNGGKRGSIRADRLPGELIEEAYINCLADYAQFIPSMIPERFTTKDYMKATRLSPRGTQRAITVLRHVGAVKMVGKDGNAYIYERNFELEGNANEQQIN